MLGVAYDGPGKTWRSYGTGVMRVLNRPTKRERPVAVAMGGIRL